jgi:tRNA U55 pseudouridine synthase TruB
VRLGITTDTLDREGQILEERDPSSVSRQHVEAVLPEFVGTIQQTPPMYSALKHEGERLHRLARRGVSIERPPREIVVRAIDLTDWTPPTFTLEVVCEGGTYVRAIAADIGDRLGCGAALDGLIRSRVGPFLGHQAVPLQAVLESEGSLQQPGAAAYPDWWLPLPLPFWGWRSLRLNRNGLQAALTGRVLDDTAGEWGALAGEPDPPFIPSAPEELAVALSPNGEFAAILERHAESQGLWRPRKVFIDRNPETSSRMASEY